MKKQKDFVDVVEVYFSENILKPIEYLIEKDYAPISAFILLSCAIDYIVGYFSNADFSYDSCRAFIEKFFPSSYHDCELTDAIVSDLRNGLVHTFSLRGARQSKKIVISQRKNNDKHLDRKSIPEWDVKNAFVLVLEDLFEDLEIAVSKFFQKARKPGKERYNLKQKICHNPPVLAETESKRLKNLIEEH